MENTLIAKSTTTIDAPIEKVWEALTTPEIIKQWFFGVDTITDWKVGSPILHRGEWQGKPFEDKGIVLKFEPLHEIVHTHWSPLSGVADSPENYNTVTMTVADRGGHTHVSIANDNNPSEESRDHSAQTWAMVLKSLKELLEK
jgi:uncharacterized protein YndB with AHSA1/START domain